MASPVVRATAESADGSAVSSHTVTLPSGIKANDLLIVCLDKGSTSATINALAGWTELLDEASANGLYIAYRYADGTEGASITLTSSANTRCASIVYRIAGAIDPATTPPAIGTTATGTSTAPNPPSVTPPSSKDYLFIAFAGMAGEEADDDTWGNTAPTNYTPSVPRQKTAGTVGTNLGGLILSAERALTTGSAEDPGAFGVDVSAAWRAQTIIVHPKAASGVDHYSFDGVDDNALFDQGALGGVAGAMSLMVVGRRPQTRTSEDTVLSLEASGGDVWAMFFTATSGNLGLWNGLNFLTSGAPVTADTEYAAFGWSKTTGTTTPRSHIVPQTGTATHQDAGGTIPNSGNSTPVRLRLSRNSDGSKWAKQDVAVVAVFDKSLTDSDWEAAMANDATQDILDLGPVACWHADDGFASDLTGNGADLNTLTGATAGTDGPPGWDYTVGGAGASTVNLLSALGVG